MSVKLVMIAILVLCKVFLSHGLNLVEGPRNISVNENDEAILACKFNEAAKNCAWSKDGEIIIVQEPYHYLGNPDTGDCSIRISKVDLSRDNGLWHCQFPRLGTNPAVISQHAKLTILVPPQEPMLIYEGSEVEMGSALSVENQSDNVTIVCLSKNGNPASQMFWLLDNERKEGSTKNETVNGDSGQLFNTESQLQLPNGPHLRGMQVKCVVEHPTYKGDTREAFAYFQVHHNTTQVTASVEGSDSTNVAADPNQRITLYCLADGIPTPSYIWSFQRRGVDTWEDWGNQQNLTVTATDGTFICRAGNTYNIDLVKSFEEIQVEVKDANNVTDKNVAAISCLSLMVLLVSGLSLFIF